jgi:hypothetical protein
VKTAHLRAFQPKKMPVQKQSEVTVQAIAEPTFQVFIGGGIGSIGGRSPSGG